MDYMVLDSQALQHLEIVESHSGTVKGSLLHYVDHCQTMFGKRQLKRWVMSPLLNITQINTRLDAIEEMMSFQHELDVLRTRMSKLPDLEKLLAKIFTYSIKHSVKAIYFEDVSLQKMREFRMLLNCFKGLDTTLDSFFKLKKSGQLSPNGRIFKLLHPTEEGGLMPCNIPTIIKEFEQLIIWKSAAGSTPG